MPENKGDPWLRLSVFRFPVQPGTPSTFYVRIEYETATFLNPIIYSQQGYQEMAGRRAVLLGIYFGLLTTIALFSLLLAPSLRDRSYFWFSLHLVLVALFYLEFNLLILRDMPLLNLLPPGNTCYFLMGALFLALAMFVRAFFFSHYRAPVAERLLVLFALLCAVGMVTALWTTSPILGSYFVGVILFGSVVMTVAAGVSVWRGFAPARIFFLGWAVVGVGMFRVLLVSHGAGDFSKGGYWNLIQLGTAVYAVVLALALSYRLRVFGAEQERKRAAAEAEQHVLRARMQQAEKLESLGMMAGGIAHDFNNLLAAVFLNADLALKQLPPRSPLLQPLNDIKRAGKHMADLARQMLDYTGKGPSDLRPLDLSKLVQDTLPLIHAGLGHRVRLGVEFEQAPPAIAGDATQLRQVLMNLVTNAAEAIESDGSVTIRTRLCHCQAHDFFGADFGHDLPDGDYMGLEVEDTGTGMDESVRPRIFDPFFTTKFTGRGLGLASVLGIVKKHGASLRIITAPGAGTTFRILFPVTDLPAETIEPAPVSEAAYEAAGTLLLVDDDEDLAYVTKLALENMGFNVLTASSGAQAIDIFRQPGCPVRVVLLDHSMPGMTGMQVIRELRQIRCDVPIILYSGYAEEQVLAPDGAGGPDFFLHKPFDDEALRGALRRVLGA
jgi:signal transduction histidine kinase/CheY-like chemotaxis protein